MDQKLKIRNDSLDFIVNRRAGVISTPDQTKCAFATLSKLMFHATYLTQLPLTNPLQPFHLMEL